MSDAPDIDAFLNQAKEREKAYDWLGAVEFYRKAWDLVSETDSLKRSEFQERVGHCFYSAAFQTENQEEFKGRMQRAVEAYEKAHGLYEKLTDEQKAARIMRCDAVAKYLGFWLTSDPSEKRRLLDECLELEAKALQLFSDAGEMREYGRTYSELPRIFNYRIAFEWSVETIRRILERGMKWGEKAIATLSKADALHELANSYLTYADCLDSMGAFIADPEKQEKNNLKVTEYLRKAVDLSERAGDSLTLGLAELMLGGTLSHEEGRTKADKALRLGERTRNSGLIAYSLSSIAYSTAWEAFAEEDPEKWRKLMEDAFQVYDRLHRIASSLPIPVGGVMMGFPYGYVDYYMYLAEREPDIEKRLGFLKKAEEAGVEAQRLAESSDSPYTKHATLTALEWIQEARAQIDSDPSEKRHCLETALKLRERVVQIRGQFIPFDFWNNGVGQISLAKLKMDLADIESDIKTKQRLLEEALSSMKEGVKLVNTIMPYMEKKGHMHLFAAVRRDQNRYAALLTRLYDLLKRPEYLRKAIEASQQAIVAAEKLGHENLIAESHWNIAKTQTLLGEHLKSAESFRHASESYERSAEKIPQLRTFYQEHASYMQAWSDIEEARHHHERQEYGVAEEHYEKAALLYKSLKQWSYLAPNYSAWAQVEKAEDLSRREQSEYAMQAFEQAAKLFTETKKSLQDQPGKIKGEDEKQMATNILKATNLRCEYCTGRINLEEAKILDKKGDHHSSSKKYGLAAETFKRVMQSLESEQDRKEFQLTITLSQAWQKMMLAEARASAELYMEASQLFEEASEQSDSEKTSFLTLGHSRFCKALEAGTKFSDTGDVAQHTVAEQHLESAAKYYVRAGFQNASDYAKATELLLDAYVHMDDAKKEKDPEKKTRLYTMAEKVLQTSAGSFMKAEHPEKREQVLRLLEKVKEDRELALSLSEVLHAPSIVSTTTAFTTPTPTKENAVGLERFEHADIQANVIARQKELNVGESLNMEIELVNAGKGPALLTKITQLIPEGFELSEKPEIYRVEDSYIDMKGKRLDPLKMVEVKLVLRPRAQGAFLIKPRVLYIDEDGKYKSHEPEPVTITVKELGIKGWIKGER